LPLNCGEGPTALAALCGALLVRYLRRDVAEARWVAELTFAAWRQRRLRQLEAEALARVGRMGEDADVAPTLPPLATIIRYCVRLERDWRRATEELAALRRDRSAERNPT
jgi:hypothetical protein